MGEEAWGGVGCCWRKGYRLVWGVYRCRGGHTGGMGGIQVGRGAYRWDEVHAGEMRGIQVR